MDWLRVQVKPLNLPSRLRIFMIEVFIDFFWNMSTALVSVIIPILALFLVFRIVHDLLWGRS